MNKCYFAPLVLPTIYDDTLSYEEHLSKVIYRLNELSEYVDTKLKNVDGYINSSLEKFRKEITIYVDNSINETEKVINDLNKKLEKYEKETHEKITNLDAKIDSKYNDAIVYVNTCVDTINATIKMLDIKLTKAIYEAEIRGNRYSDSKVNVESIKRQMSDDSLNKKIDNIVKEYPKIFNPITGKKENIEKAILDIYNGLRVCGLTCLEFQKLGLTCDEYDSLKLTAYYYDVYAKCFFEEELHKMFNPFSGKRDTVKNVIIQICNVLKFNAKTVKEYGELGFTCDEFDTSQFNAKTQDNNKQYTKVVDDLLNTHYKNYRLAWKFNGSEQGEEVATLEPVDTCDELLFVYTDSENAPICKSVKRTNEGFTIDETVVTDTDVFIYSRGIKIDDMVGYFDVIISKCKRYELLTNIHNDVLDDLVIKEIYVCNNIYNDEI